MLGLFVAIGEALAETSAFLARFGPLLARVGASAKRAALVLGQLIKANAKNIAVQLAIAGGTVALSSKDSEEVKAALSQIEAQLKELQSKSSLSTLGPSENGDNIDKLRAFRDKIRKRLKALEISQSQAGVELPSGGEHLQAITPASEDGINASNANSSTPPPEPGAGSSTTSATVAAVPLGEALTVLQKKLEEGLCPAVEGLTEKLGKVPDPGLMLGALTAPAGSGRSAAALGVSPGAFAGYGCRDPYVRKSTCSLCGVQ